VKKLKEGDFNPCHLIENPRRGTPWRARTTIFSHLRTPVARFSAGLKAGVAAAIASEN
jgi:hypothetical protein